MKIGSVFNADANPFCDDSKFYFNVVIIYDCRDSAIRAKAIFDRLTARFGDDFHFECDFWRFDVLGLPEVHQLAFSAGQTADLIIIASQTGQISSAVETWLQNCVAQKADHPSALVGLFRENSTRSLQPAMREFLKPFATGVNFFVHEVETPRSRLHSYAEDLPSREAAWRAPSAEWGINE